MSRPKYKFVPLPPGLEPPDLTVDETAAYRRESRWTTHKKIREGVYASYLEGRIRKIVFASVKADRARAIGASKKQKRSVGRPPKASAAPDTPLTDGEYLAQALSR